MKLQKGQRLGGIPARDWNRFHDAADIVLGKRSNPNGARQTIGMQNLVYVKNTNASDCPRFQALGIDGVLIAPSDDLEEFQSGWVLDGDKPASDNTHIGKFVITQEYIEAGEIGLACASGLTVVEVNVPGTAYEYPYVDIDKGNFLPAENWYGSAEIVAGPWTYDSKRWAVVRMGHFMAPPYKAVVTASSIASGGSGNCQIYIDAVARQNVTGHLNWLEGTNSAANGDEVLIRFFRDEGNGNWVIIEKEC